MLEILQTYPNAKTITLNNEPGFSTSQLISMIEGSNIKIYFVIQDIVR